MKTSIPHLAELLNIRSNRLLLRLVEEVCASLPAALRVFAEDRTHHTLSDQWDYENVFPSLAVSPAVREWRDEEDALLSLRTPDRGLWVGREKSHLSCQCESFKLTLTGRGKGVEVVWLFWHGINAKGQLAVPVQGPHGQTDGWPSVEDCTQGHSYKQVSGAPQSWYRGQLSILLTDQNTPTFIYSVLHTHRGVQTVTGLVSGVRWTFLISTFHLQFRVCSEEKIHTHTDQFHFRTGKIGYLEDKEELCERWLGCCQLCW